jgi:hypothetical protein
LNTQFPDGFLGEQDLGRIKSAVRELGYTPRLPIPQNAEDDYLAAGYECTFDSPAGKNLLELQWSLQPRFYAVDFDMGGLFERAVKATIAGRDIKTPSPEDLLVVLSVHAAKHVGGRLIWLCDIEQIVKRQDLDWGGARAQAHHLGIERILHITLLLANRFLAMPIPGAIPRCSQDGRSCARPDKTDCRLHDGWGLLPGTKDRVLPPDDAASRAPNRSPAIFNPPHVYPRSGRGGIHLPKPLYPTLSIIWCVWHGWGRDG